MDAALASMITAVIVGGVGLVNNYFANTNSLKQQEELFKKEEIRNEREFQQREKEKERERKKELETKLQEIYGNAIASLTTLLLYDTLTMRQKPEYSTVLGEAQKWLSLIVAFHYDKTSEDYSKFIKYFRSFIDWGQAYSSYVVLRELIVSFEENDPRLHL